jgi:hypothetical protein
MRLSRSLVATAGVVAFLWIGPAGAIKTKYVEDFSTTQYRDALNTTAWWDTVAGQLELYAFSINVTGSYDTPGAARNVAVDGDYAYVADYYEGLQVIDISDPSSPSLLGTYNTTGYAFRLAVSGDNVFVANYNQGLKVIDVSNPGAPTLVGSYYTSQTYGVAVAGDLAYLADGVNGIKIIDISNPSAPAQVGVYNTAGAAHDVEVEGDYAYLAGSSGGLQVIDVSDPTTPTETAAYITGNAPVNLDVSGNYAYLAELSGGITVVDITDPASPSEVGGISTAAGAQDVSVDGDFLYVATDVAGLTVFDISDPSSPVLLGMYDTPGTALGVTAWGRHVLVADQQQGLQVVEVMDLMPPIEVGVYQTVDYATRLAIAGDRAYASGGINYMEVVDISDPTGPTSVSTYSSANCLAVAVSGDLGFLASNSNQLEVLDISNALSVAQVGTYATTGYISDLVVDGDYVYLADREAGLNIIDVSNPTAPALLGGYDPAGSDYHEGIAFAGDYVYLSDANTGLHIIDVGNPASPALVGSYNTPGSESRLAAAGDYVFLCTDDGFYVVDVSNPAAPSLAGSADIRYCVNVELSGDIAWVSGLYSPSFTSRIVDISDPANPTVIREIGQADVDAVIEGRYVYTAVGGVGIKVRQLYSTQFQTSSNTARSLAVDDADYIVASVRLNTTQVDSIGWEVSADSGTSWEEIIPGGSWVDLASPGTDLLWRSIQYYLPGGGNPACSGLELEWRFAYPAIDAIEDIPEDQGGQVRVSWYGFASDLAGAVEQTVEYAVYRRAGANWDYVATVPARAEELYSVVVPTLADSSVAGGMQYSVFFVRARTATPGVYVDSPPDSGYSVDNLIPGPPSGMSVVYNTGHGNSLSWQAPDVPDLECYRVYRGDVPDFIPSPAALVGVTSETTWTDPDQDGGSVHYKVTAVDQSGNESPPASDASPTGVGLPAAPDCFALYQNSPNPFNPATTIRYDVAGAGAHVTLRVYDVAGRVVTTLVDGWQSPGHKSVLWNGLSAGGARSASGVYFYRLSAPGFEQTRKMVMLE